MKCKNDFTMFNNVTFANFNFQLIFVKPWLSKNTYTVIIVILFQRENKLRLTFQNAIDIIIRNNLKIYKLHYQNV